MSNSKQSKEYFENIEYYKKMHINGYKLSTGKTRIPGKHTTEKAPSFLQN